MNEVEEQGMIKTHNTEINMESLDSVNNAYKIIKNTKKEIDEQMTQTSALVSYWDAMFCDYRHIMEMANISWWNRICLYEKMLHCLNERRKAKDKYSLFQAINHGLETHGEKDWDKIVKNRENLEKKRSYKFRAITKYGKCLQSGAEIKI